MLISHRRLKLLLSYNPEDGSWRRMRAKSPFQISSGHYLAFYIEGKAYASHRLAWFYMHGTWPSGDIDHKNGNKRDNRRENLRACSRSQNLGNAQLNSKNTSGLKGVSFNKEKKKWVATIGGQPHQKYLGQFNCPAAAHFAYLIAADIRYGEFARAR